MASAAAATTATLLASARPDIAVATATKVGFAVTISHILFVL
jgi:hypothetical protein